MAIVSLLNLTEADKLSGSEVIPVNQCGTTKRLPVSAISGGGENSETNGTQAIVLAGCNNKALSSFGVVVQGCNNSATSSIFNTVLNGLDNNNLSIGYGTIIGGRCHLIAGCNNNNKFSTILNGQNNKICAGCGSLLGGLSNTINTPGNKNNIILGGDSASILQSNIASSCNIILAGTNFSCDNTGTVIGSGMINIIRRSGDSFIGAGSFNQVLSSSCSFIGTGLGNNITSGERNIIVGGSSNSILSGSNGGILGGLNNGLSGNNSFIIGTGIKGCGDCTTFVNKLSATCSIHAGNGFTGTVTISSNAGDKSMVITDGIITGLS
tara:strand:+ start:341 stop:1312 length:972 start_codon:yes stop_codon:yes gene_type:complete